MSPMSRAVEYMYPEMGFGNGWGLWDVLLWIVVNPTFVSVVWDYIPLAGLIYMRSMRMAR